MRNSFVVAIGWEVIVENSRVKTENCLKKFGDVLLTPDPPDLEQCDQSL